MDSTQNNRTNLTVDHVKFVILVELVALVESVAPVEMYKSV
jgi:hypothetical protein